MLRNRIQKSKFKSQNHNVKFKTFKFLIIVFTFTFYLLPFYPCSFAQDEFTYDSKGKRNPFIPLVTSTGKLLKLDTEESSIGLLLEGIIYDDRGLSYAIVNGEVVKIGDIINDYQVLKIEKNKIIFIKEGEPLELELKKEE